MSKERLYIFDTTLRDGAQTQGVDFSLEDKEKIALALDNLGVDYIEAGWPGANPTDTEFFQKKHDFKNRISGQIIRLALMSAHYKQPLDWNDKLLSDCEGTLDKWYKVYSSDLKSVKVSEEILKPLYEDLNTPGYIANLHKLFEKANKGENRDLFVSACKFIGLMNETSEQWNEFKKKRVSITESEIENILSLRDKARENKNYKEADRIRDELLDKGVLIEDKDGKTLWKFK